MDRPRFSVVVPAYNAAGTVGQTLRSAVEQEYRDFEVVVVNDGSTDRTEAVVQSVGDDRIRLVSQENRGLAPARNAGIAEARGELLAFLDADDVWLPDYLATMDGLARSHPDAGLFFADAYQFDGRTVWRKTVAEGTPPPAQRVLGADRFLLEILERNWVWVSTVVRREALERVGGFNPELAGVADWEMWIRIAAGGYGAAAAGRPLGLYRRSAGQMSGNKLKMETEIRDMYAMLAAGATLPDDLRARAGELRASWDARLEAGGTVRPVAHAGVRGRLGRIRHKRLIAPAAARRTLRRTSA